MLYRSIDMTCLEYDTETIIDIVTHPTSTGIYHLVAPQSVLNAEIIDILNTQFESSIATY